MTKVLQLLRALRTKRRGVQESEVVDRKSYEAESSSASEQEAARQKAEVIELPMNLTSKMRLGKLAGRSPTPKEKRRRNAAIGCIVLASSVGLAFTWGTWSALCAFMERCTIAHAPTRMSASASVVPSAYQITSDEASTQTFEDGTDVEMSAQTTVEVDYSAGRRVVRLRAGSAMFNVAKNRHRPFVVLADGLSATAVGTKFRVTLAPRVRVDVYEGEVAVSEGEAVGEVGVRLKAGESYERPRPAK